MSVGARETDFSGNTKVGHRTKCKTKRVLALPKNGAPPDGVQRKEGATKMTKIEATLFRLRQVIQYDVRGLTRKS